MEKVVSHPSVNWLEYFKSIRQECPWALAAYQKGLIDIQPYEGTAIPLGQYSARVYVIHAPDATVEAICAGLNHGADEWLFSYPGYGAFAPTVSILIQQNRAELARLRTAIDSKIPE